MILPPQTETHCLERQIISFFTSKFSQLYKFFLLNLKGSLLLGILWEVHWVDGWMALPHRWTWVWASSRSWWWTGKPSVLQSMELQRVGHDWGNKVKILPRGITVLFDQHPNSPGYLCYQFALCLCRHFPAFRAGFLNLALLGFGANDSVFGRASCAL